ncbi:hypothetical protein AB0M11_23855 [Streptomyces sp. NPDC051987]|uniref:hypothetical protein n=1 Tax=Streptomyces sp. NPDC051987 TaxID=3155808 RepID=UPI003428FC0B
MALRDGCAWDDERLRGGAGIGLGRALLSRPTDGTPRGGLTVNTHRPLFWFLAGPACRAPADREPPLRAPAALTASVVNGGRTQGRSWCGSGPGRQASPAAASCPRTRATSDVPV